MEDRTLHEYTIYESGKDSGKIFGKGEYKMKVQLLFIRKDNENDEL